MAAPLLLIDDEDANIALAMQAIEDAGWHDRVDLHTAKSGEEGLAFLGNEPPFESAPTPFLIFLDLNLPGMTGREVLKHAKQDPRLRAIPIVIMSTSSAPTDVIFCKSAHANAFVTKPTNYDQFVSKMNSTLSFWLECAEI